MATNKKVTRVGSSSGGQRPAFVPTAENKSKAKSLRLYAILIWVAAIAIEVLTIVLMCKWRPNNDVEITTGQSIALIALILVELGVVILGQRFWKQSNRLDPGSEKDGLMFTLQNQLGMVVAALAFVPVIIVALIKKLWVIFAVALAALGVSGYTGHDNVNPSQEKYAAESSVVQELMGADKVYWTPSGTKYHLYDDCRYINSSKTKEIYEGGSVADCYAKAPRIKNQKDGASPLCSACKDRAMKEKGITQEQLDKAIEADSQAQPNAADNEVTSDTETETE
jgi:hypothetical protein